MVRVAEVQEKLLPLIGWEQNFDTTDIRIADSLTKSESGLFYQQMHPLLTLDNLASIAPDFKNIHYQEYVEGVSYKKGNIVSYNSILYKALLDNSDSPSNSQAWSETNPFSEWLEGKTKASIQKAIVRFINEKLVQGTHKSLCENKTLFDGTGRIVDVVKNRNNLVGFEIIPVRSKGVTVKINKIGLQFTEPGTYKLYLFHSSLSEPVKTIELVKTKKNSFEWFSFNDLYLPYQSEDTDAGGSWYLCYLQTELPEGSQAIQKNKDWSKEPCATCSRNEHIAWKAWSKFLEVHPFYVNEEVLDKNNMTMWNQAGNFYTYDNNYGINLEVSVECDLTDFIVEQRHLFQGIVAKQVAIDILREFAYNPNVRTNRHAINASRVDILYEIDGDSSSMKKSGLSYQLELALKAVSLDTKGLDRVCLPCKNNGVKYRSAV